VLSRFEGFPSKKLEAIRMAAALYNKLDSILNELQNLNIVTPVTQFLDKVERYFNKVIENPLILTYYKLFSLFA
jgi:Wiskott-Aldrich syndrome protein